MTALAIVLIIVGWVLVAVVVALIVGPMIRGPNSEAERELSDLTSTST